MIKEYQPSEDQEHQELFDAVESTPRPEPTVTDIQEKAKELRDQMLHKADLEEQLALANARIHEIQSKELVDMFAMAGISSLSVDADGNHPGFTAELKTAYSAKIPEDRRKEAFMWFEDTGNGDLIKAVVSVIFGMQEHDKRIKLLKLLEKHGYEFRSDETIHWMTLRAFVKREIQKNHIIPRDLLGVNVWDEVKIKED